MKFTSFIFVLCLISCTSSEITPEPLTFVESALEKHHVNINLPEFEHGFPFVANDSITYVNIYVINDSVVQVNDSLFELEDWIEDKTTKYPDFSNYKKDADSLGLYLENLDNDSSVFNFLLDTSCHFEILDNIFYSFINNYWDSKNHINIIDRNNKVISLLKVKIGGGCTPNMIHERNILEIFLNKDNQLLIENEFDKSLSDIPNYVKKWYTNPRDEDWLPRMIVFTENEIRKNIAILKNNLENSKSGKGQNTVQQQLAIWEKKLKTQQIIGDYRTLNKAATMFVQADKRCDLIDYLTILDKVNEGLFEARNELCLHSFNLKYNKLNLKFTKQKKIKNAIDEVYPIKLVPAYIITAPSEPPPPPPLSHSIKY